MPVIIRIEAFRFLVWNDSRENNACPNFFVTGIRSDGTAYFRNKNTELPNEFQLYPEDYPLRLFVTAKSIIEALIKNPKPGNFPHCHETWVLNLHYSDGTSSRLQYVDKDIHFSFSDYNDFLSDHTFWGKQSDSIVTYCGSLTLDDVRGEVASRHVPFERFYDHRIRTMIDDDGIDSRVIFQPDGSIWIDRIILSHHQQDFITIDPNGNILNDGCFPYVRVLKDHGVRVIRKTSSI